MSPKFLVEHGYNVKPVNQTADELLGRKSYQSMLEVPENIEVVDVFRKSEDVPLHAEEAVKRGVKVFWMQEGIDSKESAQLLRGAGITVVWDRCVMKEHSRLFGSKMRVSLGKI